MNVSVFTLSAIAVDRYRAVLFPLKPRVSKRKAAWAILTIWTMAFLIALPTWLDYKYVIDQAHSFPSVIVNVVVVKEKNLRENKVQYKRILPLFSMIFSLSPMTA